MFKKSIIENILYNLKKLLYVFKKLLKTKINNALKYSLVRSILKRVPKILVGWFCFMYAQDFSMLE